MNGWSPKDYALTTSTVVGASVTNQAISSPFPITAGGALNMVVCVKASSVTVTNAITITLQTSVHGDYQTSKTASIAANGWTFIRLNVQDAADQAFLPLLAQGRVDITTGVGDTATITAVAILQEL